MEPGGRGEKLPPRGAKVFVERLGARAAVKHLKDLCGEFLKNLATMVEQPDTEPNDAPEKPQDAQKGA